MRPAKKTPWTGGSGTSQTGLLRGCLDTVPAFLPLSWARGSLPLPGMHTHRGMYTDMQTHTHIRTHAQTHANVGMDNTCSHKHV